MQDKLPDAQNTPAVTERRACPRLRVTSLMYIDIGDVNGGIVTSLSENGLALMAAVSLGNANFGDGPLRVRIQFPGVPDAIEARGEIVWTSSSGKEACVRFVEPEEKAHKLIRSWISSQASGNSLGPDSPKLPKMRLPSSRRAKHRPGRFSFSDVACSRVDAESETGVEDFREMPAEPGGPPPPLQVGTVTFRDGKEAVASAFESPVFTDRQNEAANQQRPKTSSDELPQRQPTPSIPERRQRSRRPILLFTYAVLGEDNGGLVFNLGEGGLAFTAAAALQDHHFEKIRVRFPDSADWFETSGRLAWKNDSGKEAGIEFAGLPEDARARIAEWVLQSDPAPGLQSTDGESRSGESPMQELPGFMETQESSADYIETPAAFEEEPFENQALEERRFSEEHHFEFEDGARTTAASSSALFKTGLKGILERASVRRRVAKIKPPRVPDHSAPPRTRVTSKALSIAAGVALAVGGWMFFQRNSSNEARGIIAKNLPAPQPSQEALQKPDLANTDVGTPTPTIDPPVHLNENSAAQADIAKPPAPQLDGERFVPDASKAVVQSPSANPDRASQQKPRHEEAVANALARNSTPRTSNEAQRPSPSQREREPQSPQLTSSLPPASSSENKPEAMKRVEIKPAPSQPVQANPVESNPVQTAQNFPAPNKELNAASPSLSANLSQPTQPAAAPPVNLEKEKLTAAPKQPEPPVARTPVVTVSFDPFPSIRMPKEEKSKKSRQGKSLQMGRLVTRVDPVYPEEAKQQGIEGTARVHAIFNREGAVQSVISVSGPPLLVSSAMTAVRQWRYSQTILGGQAMETEEDVTVLFRLANSGSKN